MRGVWTTEQEEYLKIAYPGLVPPEEMEEKIGKNWKAIKSRAFKLKLTRDNPNKFKTGGVSFMLGKRAPTVPFEELVPFGTPYSIEEIAYLKENYMTMSHREMSLVLKRKKNSVKTTCKIHGFLKFKGNFMIGRPPSTRFAKKRVRRLENMDREKIDKLLEKVTNKEKKVVKGVRKVREKRDTEVGKIITTRVFRSNPVSVVEPEKQYQRFASEVKRKEKESYDPSKNANVIKPYQEDLKIPVRINHKTIVYARNEEDVARIKDKYKAIMS